jgi:hypothetical protein
MPKAAAQQGAPHGRAKQRRAGELVRWASSGQINSIRLLEV